MKRLLSLFLCLLMIIGCFAGCKENSKTINPENKQDNNRFIMQVMDSFSGEYIKCSNDSKYNFADKIIINDDYTGKYGYNDFYWEFCSKITETNYGLFKIKALFDDKSSCLFEFKIDGYNVYTLIYNSREYYKKDAFEIVNITLDNYQKYFEIQDFVIPEHDQFGDLYRMEYSKLMIIKEDIEREVDIYKSNITFDCEYVESQRKISIDPESGTVNYLEFLEGYFLHEGYFKENFHLSNRKIVDFSRDVMMISGFFAGNIYSISQGYSTVLDPYITDVKIHRITGELFLYKN